MYKLVSALLLMLAFTGVENVATTPKPVALDACYGKTLCTYKFTSAVKTNLNKYMETLDYANINKTLYGTLTGLTAAQVTACKNWIKTNYPPAAVQKLLKCMTAAEKTKFVGYVKAADFTGAQNYMKTVCTRCKLTTAEQSATSTYFLNQAPACLGASG